jgi:hypothetical protein
MVQPFCKTHFKRCSFPSFPSLHPEASIFANGSAGLEDIIFYFVDGPYDLALVGVPPCFLKLFGLRRFEDSSRLSISRGSDHNYQARLGKAILNDNYPRLLRSIS